MMHLVRSITLATWALPMTLACTTVKMPEPGDSARSEVDANSASLSRRTFLGLRTAKYSARDLAGAKEWYSRVLDAAPYFDQPFYVGFDVGGFELGIVPDSTAAPLRSEAGVAYWGVTNADSALLRLISLGATPYEGVIDAGSGVRIGAVRDPFGNILGVVENPQFRVRD